MKQLISALAVCCMIAASCTKEISSQPNTASGSASADSVLAASARENERHGNDDTRPDDNGGKNGDNGGGVSTSSVPTAVMHAFNSRYSNPTHVEWKKLSDGSFKVEFFLGSAKVEATFSATGKLLKEERR